MSSASTRIRQTSEPGTNSYRVTALDFTKGALVLLMVLYHWLNYFFSTEGDIFRYLRFVTPSFIFITGFLIAHVYLSKGKATAPGLAAKLLQRGLKILALFICLNIAISFLFSNSYSGRILFGDLSVKNIIAIYVTGNVVIPGIGKAAAFYILVPISYLLLLSSGLLTASKNYKHIFRATCLVSLLVVLILNSNGIRCPNLELVSIGLLGIVAGFIPIENINSFIAHPYTLAAAYLGYVLAITAWNVIYPLQIVGVFLSVIIIYLMGSKRGAPGRLRNHVILLGKYSLFGYIAQIAILQILYRGIRHFDLGRTVVGISLLAAFLLTMISVEALHRTRARVHTVDRLYKVVFA